VSRLRSSFGHCLLSPCSASLRSSCPTLNTPVLCWVSAEHSDKDALHAKAEEVRRDEAIKDYKERKQRVKEVCMQCLGCGMHPGQMHRGLCPCCSAQQLKPATAFRSLARSQHPVSQPVHPVTCEGGARELLQPAQWLQPVTGTPMALSASAWHLQH